MKKIIVIILLSFLLAITVFAETKSDYIPPTEPPSPKQEIVVIGIPSGVKPEHDQYYLMAYDAFEGDQTMLAIGMAESKFDPKAKNPESTAEGLYQILKGIWKLHKCEGTVTDPKDNLACAKKIKEDSGYIPWNASSDNW